MAEENKMNASNQIDFEQVYKVMSGYVEFCIRAQKTKLSDKDKEGLTTEEITAKESELKQLLEEADQQKKNYQKAYDALFDAIGKDGIENLSIYVNALKKLYEEKADWKKDIKAALVSPKSLRTFKEARSNISELYPVLVIINEVFPVEEYIEISLLPKAAIYGSEVNKTTKGSTKKMPLSNEEIQTMLGILAEKKDYVHLGNWIKEILLFNSQNLIDLFVAEYTPKREQLKMWLYKQIESNEEFKISIMNELFKNGMFRELTDAMIKTSTLKKEVMELKETNRCLEEEKESYEERRIRQFEMIQERNERIAKLQVKASDLERCSEKLNNVILQNDNLKKVIGEYNCKVSNLEDECLRLKEEVQKAASELEQLQVDYSALQADFSLKNNELSRLKETTSKKEESGKMDVMKELVTGINEHIFYLTMFYMELEDTGKLEPESIELYADTLNNIDDVLEKIGIKKLGVIDEIVKYDSSEHISTDAKIANGELVTVSGYGWKIGEEVYIKVPVEKGE